MGKQCERSLLVFDRVRKVADLASLVKAIQGGFGTPEVLVDLGYVGIVTMKDDILGQNSFIKWITKVRALPFIKINVQHTKQQ